MFYQLHTSSRLPPAFHVLFICLDGSLPFHGCHTALCYGLLPPRCHIAEPLLLLVRNLVETCRGNKHCFSCLGKDKEFGGVINAFSEGKKGLSGAL